MANHFAELSATDGVEYHATMGAKQEKGGKVMRRLVVTVAMFILLGALAAGAYVGKTIDEEGRVSVNGVEIANEEFKLYLDLNRARVADYFQQTYGAAHGKDFWEKEYGDENPLEHLVAAAKEELVRAQVEKQLAMQAGVLTDTSFEAFLREMKEEEDRRSDAHARGEPVYGPLRLELLSFYSYYMSAMRNAALQALLANGTIKLEEGSLDELALKRLAEQRYDEIVETNYRIAEVEWPKSAVMKRARQMQ